MIDAWPWLMFAGLGAFHGLNPAMGWLFAVALGLHRQSRAVVMVSLVPIAVGHAAAVALAAALLVVAGYLVPHDLVSIGAGLLLLAWAAWHWRFGRRHRVRFGMQIGALGLIVWSFLMASAHGAGLMLWPALMASCMPAATQAASSGPSIATAFAGVGLHTLAMLLTTAVVAVLVYEWLGLSLLRTAWFNVDLVWVVALVATGTLLVLTAVL